MTVEFWTVFFTILNTFILYAILKKYFFDKVNNFMEARRLSIENKIKEANENYEKAEKLLKEYEEKLRSLETEGKKLIEEYKKKANDLYEDILDEAKKESEVIIERAKKEAKLEIEKAKDDIKRQIVDLSFLAASKAIEKELDYEMHHRLIMDFIDKVGS
ncbi:MAG: F0F1 ATP synthase subunit B [Caloramator sp.]|nr:F0F1 ATP synthase subunit B [Caloramator sp.]